MKISIITVAFNTSNTIESTLSSVCQQIYPNIEHVVIDGGSTDGTVEIIHRYAQSLAFWVSEPDEGISAAMNKGLSRITGDYVLFLNADDYLLGPNAIGELVPYLTQDIVGGALVKIDHFGRNMTVHPRGFDVWFNFKTGVYHQSTLCSVAVAKELGGFSEDLNLAMDYEFFLRAYRSSCSFRKVAMPFSVMRSGGASTRTDYETIKARLLEERKIHFRNSTNIGMNILYRLYWVAYPRFKLRKASSVQCG